ncbi:MAG: hypothetical protein ACK40M_03610 [Flavobacteriales bacterium]
MNAPKDLDHYSEAKFLSDSGYDSKAILARLHEKGIDEIQAQETLNKLKKEHLEKRRKRGVIFIAIGGICLFSGFLLSAILFHSNSSPAIPLYGMTSIGIILLLAGMADCLGL